MFRNTKQLRRFRPTIETLEARRLLSVYADFNADGFDDLAIGVPGENNGSGMVQVLYGSAGGLTSTGSQSWTQSSLGTDSSEAGDAFGAALAGGDFNNDGFTDLAVGVPGEDVGSIVDAGLVHFVLGSATGLTGAGDYIMHQDINRVRDTCETGDAFGSSLAAGYFNDDDFADLAVGVPGQDIPGKVDAGSIHVFYGGGQAIKPPGNQTFNMDSPGMAATANAGAALGSSLASGDFNNDGRDDIAAGAPFYDNEGFSPNSGTVIIIKGSAVGISPAGSQSALLAGTDVQQGHSVAAGDFDGDGFDDLASGAPFDLVGMTATAAGEVRIFSGSAGGLSFDLQMQQGNFGDPSEANDNFGASLVAADFNGDGRADLAIGVPGESTIAVPNAGQVTLVFGSATGLSSVGTQQIKPVDVGLAQEVDDFFGDTVTAGDFNGNAFPDLVIGSPRDNVGAVVDAGSVFVLYSVSGPVPQTWNQDTAGISDTAETGDNFGGGLDASAGRGINTPRDPVYLITADVNHDDAIAKRNKRRR